MSKSKYFLDFIRKSNIKHNFKYCYSQSVYINNNTKIKIECPHHGYFYQIPRHHSRGHGCKLCAISKLASIHKSNTEDFAEKALSIHNNTFSYDNVNYVDAHTKVSITCHIHGEFNQTPNHHLNGKGCAKCGVNNARKLTHIGLKSFIERAKKIHGDKYDYSKSVYINAHTLTKIICSKHGEFYQIPWGHLSGKGCLICSHEKSVGGYNLTNIERNKDYFKNIDGCVYIAMANKEKSVYKIGITSNINDRLANLKMNKNQCVKLIKANMYEAFYIEQSIHIEYDGKRITYGIIDGKTEHFILNDHDISSIIDKYAHLDSCGVDKLVDTICAK